MSRVLTKYRRKVFTDDMLTFCEHTMAEVCADLSVSDTLPTQKWLREPEIVGQPRRDVLYQLHSGPRGLPALGEDLHKFARMLL
ncbi:hypothetical protein [Mycobacterium simiae]|uniref:Uncharacterized protein n=1 Tax=Mycobacterium simiae TaxID=1784 RepID=A0A1X0XJE8_MYCSI|nr:hypothetical protein [Mycobacterium simiae]ORJ53010.1 hypothetical protein B5M45_29840 [Mycobacterium simiae]